MNDTLQIDQLLTTASALRRMAVAGVVMHVRRFKTLDSILRPITIGKTRYYTIKAIDDLIWQQVDQAQLLLTTKDTAERHYINGSTLRHLFRTLGIRPVPDGTRTGDPLRTTKYWRKSDGDYAVSTYRAWVAADKPVTWAVWIASLTTADVTPTEICPPSGRGQTRPTIKVNDSKTRISRAVEIERDRAVTRADAVIRRKKAAE